MRTYIPVDNPGSATWNKGGDLISLTLELLTVITISVNDKQYFIYLTL